MGLNIYYNGYVTKTGYIPLLFPHWNVNSVNPLYLLINRIDGFVEEKDGDNSEEVWNGIKDCIEKINDSELGEYDKDFTNTKFNSDDDIPLIKQFYFLTITVIISNIFEKGGKYYPQCFLVECLYEV